MNRFGIHWAFIDQNWYWFIIIPVILFLFMLSSKKRAQVLNLLVHSPKIQFKRPRNRPLKNFLFILGLFFVLVAYMGPQWGQKPHVVKAEGLDICFAIDLSRSMLVEDMSPNRLTQIKNQLAIFLPKLTGDRVTIAAFAGTGYVVAPLSSDYAAIQDFIEPLEPDFISDQSTRISAALDSCAEGLQVKNVKNYSEIEEDAAKVIVLLSDGEDTVEENKFSVEQSKKLNIPIFSMAIGTEEGGPVPVYDGNGNVAYYLKNGSEPVLSRLKDKALKELADETGAKVFYASNGIKAWDQFKDSLNDFQRKTQEAGFLLDWEHRYQIFLLIAFIILLLEFMISEIKMKIRWLPFLLFFIFSNSGFSQISELPKVFYNNRAVGENQEEKFTDAKNNFGKALEENPADLNVQFNWATNQLNALKKAPLAKNEKRSEEEIKDIVETLENVAKNTSDDMLKKEAQYQIAQAYELTEDKKKAIEHYYRSIQGMENEELDLKSQNNLARLLEDPQQQQQGEGDGQGGQGQGGNNQGDENKKISQDKQESKYKGTDYSEQEVKKILQSVSSEEKDVQRRKARGEAKKNERAQQQNGEDGQGIRAPQY